VTKRGTQEEVVIIFPVDGYEAGGRYLPGIQTLLLRFRTQTHEEPGAVKVLFLILRGGEGFREKIRARWVEIAPSLTQLQRAARESAKSPYANRPEGRGRVAF